MKVKETYLVHYYGRGCELYLTESDVWVLNKPYGSGDGGHYNVLTKIDEKEAKRILKNNSFK